MLKANIQVLVLVGTSKTHSMFQASVSILKLVRKFFFLKKENNNKKIKLK